MLLNLFQADRGCWLDILNIKFITNKKPLSHQGGLDECHEKIISGNKNNVEVWNVVSSKLYHPNIASVIKYFLFNEVFVGVNTFLTKKGQFQCLRCKLLNFYKAGKFRGGIIFKYPSVYSRLQYRHVYSFQE